MSIFSRFTREEDAQALALFAVSMPAFLGLSLLAIDIGRGNNLHYDLQKGVDSLALTAAAELNGSPTAIPRADAAVTGELVNRTRFADQNDPYLGLDLSNITVTYLSEIPADDDQDIAASMILCTTTNSGSDCTEDDSYEAAFAWVRAMEEANDDNRKFYTSIFPVTLASGSATVPVAADAVAGYVNVICDIPPIYVCNPLEAAEGPELEHLYKMLRDENGVPGEYYGRQIWSRYKSSDPYAGNFGFLDVGSGAADLGQEIATAFPRRCERSDGTVITEPGNMANLDKAFNTRFGMYKGDFGTNRQGAQNWPPAHNVRTGFEDKCENNPSRGLVTDGYAQPGRDSCDYNGGSCPVTDADGETIVGDGQWDFETYWTVNHPTRAAPNGWSNTSGGYAGNPPSRYDVHRAEIDNDWIHDESLGVNGVPEDDGDGEPGEPQTSAPACGNITPKDDRRLITGVINNCIQACSGGECPTGKSTLDVLAFGTFYISESIHTGGTANQSDEGGAAASYQHPVHGWTIDPAYPTDGDGILRLELVDLIGPEGIGTIDAISRNEAVLYR